ncbi:MAG: Tad domain-containing protein [Bdellovibrionota bacterium]|nr:MAG: Tad domain-containing protein [Bdellovibrionota bacterium]
MATRNVSSNHNQRGVYLSLMALATVALLAVLILAIGTGFVLTGRARLKNVANVTALAALERFTSTDESTFDARANAALARANYILGENSIPGFASMAETLSHASPGVPGEANRLTLGMYYARPPGGDAQPCGEDESDYPCFVPRYFGTTAPPVANAARVDISVPITFGLGRFLGQETFLVAASSVATMRPQSTAYLLDVSLSTTRETHRLADSFGVHPCLVVEGIGGCSGPSHAACQSLLDTPGFYNVCRACKIQANQCYPAWAIKTQELLNHEGEPIWGNDEGEIPPVSEPFFVGLPFLREEATKDSQEYLCRDPDLIFEPGFPERRYWCNTPSPTGGGYPAPPLMGEPVQHLRPHYQTRNTPFGLVRYDSLFLPGQYEGPQPFIRFFKAFNVGLREVRARATEGDRAMFSAFVGKIRDTYPDPDEDGESLTENLGFLVQLTNAENRGLVEWDGDSIPGTRIHPNFIDRGWFPIMDADPLNNRTNLVVAIYRAAERLMEFSAVGARKTIVLASDGLGICTFNPALANPEDPASGITCPTNRWNGHVGSNNQLIQGGLSELYPSIKDMLSVGEISLTVLLDSDRLNLALYNRVNVDAGCGNWFEHNRFIPDNPACYINQENARAFGFVQAAPGGEPQSDWFLDSRSIDEEGVPTIDHETVFSQSDGRLGLAVGVLANLAIGSGGLICPLLEPGAPTQYHDFSDPERDCAAPCPECPPCTLKSEFRQPNELLTISPLYLTKTEQAAFCVARAVNAVPFILTANARFEDE